MVTARWARLPDPIVPYVTTAGFAFATRSTSANVLYGKDGCAVITIGDLPRSMIGVRSFSVSKGMFGIRLGVTPLVSNTSRNVYTPSGDLVAMPEPIEPEAPPRLSTTTDTPSDCCRWGCSSRATWSVVAPGGKGTMIRIG